MEEVCDNLEREAEQAYTHYNGVLAEVQKFRQYKLIPEVGQDHPELRWRVNDVDMPNSLTGVVNVYLNSITHKWQVRIAKLRNMWTSGHHYNMVKGLRFPGTQYLKRQAGGKNEEGFPHDFTNLDFMKHVYN